jgi:hypothetical protein
MQHPRSTRLKNYLPARWILPLLLLAAKPAASQDMPDAFYQNWVEYRDGEISLAFNQTPVELALYAIRARTGLQIVVPAAAENKVLSLQLNRVPLEPAVRSFILYIGFKNFALMYDGDGRPKRAVVLGTVSDDGSTRSAVKTHPAPTNESIAQPLTTEEREEIKTALGSWSDLKQEERDRIEDRLKTLPPSKDREQLVAEYGRQILGIRNEEPSIP